MRPCRPRNRGRSSSLAEEAGDPALATSAEVAGRLARSGACALGLLLARLGGGLKALLCTYYVYDVFIM